MAGVRHKATGKLEPFMDHVRGLLRQAGVLYADEPPARATGGAGKAAVRAWARTNRTTLRSTLRLTAPDRASAQSQVREQTDVQNIPDCAANPNFR